MIAPIADVVHLARRLFASLRPFEPSARDEALARGSLDEQALDLWLQQAPGDRRHSAAVAREVARAAGDEPVPEWVITAALLHDVGKVDTGLGVVGRVVAGVLKLVRVGRFPGRVGRYLRYPEVGAAMLADAGCDPRAVAWAAEHHRPARQRTAPARWADRLAAADHQAV